MLFFGLSVGTKTCDYNYTSETRSFEKGVANTWQGASSKVPRELPVSEQSPGPDDQPRALCAGPPVARSFLVSPIERATPAADPVSQPLQQPAPELHLARYSSRMDPQRSAPTQLCVFLWGGMIRYKSTPRDLCPAQHQTTEATVFTSSPSIVFFICF